MMRWLRRSGTGPFLARSFVIGVGLVVAVTGVFALAGVQYRSGWLVVIVLGALILAPVYNRLYITPRRELVPLATPTPFGQWMIEARRYWGWSTADLAHASGIREAFITDLEVGRIRFIDDRLTRRITDALQHG
jgi:hypothetical protein